MKLNFHFHKSANKTKALANIYLKKQTIESESNLNTNIRLSIIIFRHSISN